MHELQLLDEARRLLLSMARANVPTAEDEAAAKRLAADIDGFLAEAVKGDEA